MQKFYQKCGSDKCLPMKIMKLVMKNPIQTHVIIGTFWGFENQYVYKIQKGFFFTKS